MKTKKNSRRKARRILDALKSLVKNDLLDIKIAAKQINVTEEEFRKMMAKTPII